MWPESPHTHLRRHGHRGGAILPHRAIWSLYLPRRRLAIGALMAAAYTALLAGAQPWLSTAWSEQLLWWMQALDLHGHFAMPEAAPYKLLSLPVPLIDLPLRAVTRGEVAAHGLALVTLWTVAGWFSDHAKPGAYVLRFAVLLHGVSVLYFLFWPASFPHALSGHVAGGLRQAWVLMLVTPWLHLFTYYLFPFPLWQGAALTALTLLFLIVLAPLQYASHAALMHLAGPIAMPTLYLLFGLLVQVLGLVALFGWAMSWCEPAPEAQEA